MEYRKTDIENWIKENEMKKLEDVFKVTQGHLSKVLREKKMRRFVPDDRYQAISDAYLACLVLRSRAASLPRCCGGDESQEQKELHIGNIIGNGEAVVGEICDLRHAIETDQRFYVQLKTADKPPEIFESIEVDAGVQVSILQGLTNEEQLAIELRDEIVAEQDKRHK